MVLNFNRAVVECFTEKVVFEERPERDEGPSHLDTGGNHFIKRTAA